MILIDMRYLWSPINRKIFEFESDKLFDEFKELHPEDLEVNQDEAYMRLFNRISHSMGLRYYNYRNMDICEDVQLMMMERYHKKGLFAPDKPFTDNAKMWWSYANKSCLYLIRCYNKHCEKETPVDLFTIEKPSETFFEVEHTSLCDDIKAYLDNLTISNNASEQQMGLYAMCKLNGLDNDGICQVLGVSIYRVREIKAALKKAIRRRFGEDL